MSLSAAPGGSSVKPENSGATPRGPTRLISFGFRVRVIELKQVGKARSTI
jgi:hypothetical protein